MRQPAARRIGARRVNRDVTFFNARDLAVFVHHERRPVRDAEILDQNPVLLGNRAHVIAENRIADVEFLLPVRQGRREIGTDRYDLRFICIELCNTRLVCVEFLRSTTGESGHEEG